MISGITVKVCGLASATGIEAAARVGADYLGFNLYRESPRFLTFARYRELAPWAPAGKRVAVMVEPSSSELAAAIDEGFDFYQIHYRHGAPHSAVTGWAQMVGAERLWLAPKLPPEMDIDASLLPRACAWLIDTFDAKGFGGSGRAGDWGKFARRQQAHPKHTWILAGGLNPENIGEALAQSGARFVDVNSGVESAPGAKDPAKLENFARAIAAARA